jgi:DNA-binding NtrC family response regulator
MRSVRLPIEMERQPAGWRRQPRVLVVDADARMRRLLEFNLTRVGCAVLTCERGDQALNLLHRTPDVDLVVLNLRLPDVGGLDALRQLRRRPKPPSVIMVADSATLEEETKCLREGAYDFVRKTGGFDDLQRSIRNAIQTVGLKQELNRLKVRLGERDLRFPELVAASPAMTAVMKRVRTASDSDVPVLLIGESGTGKETIAQVIHAQGALRDKPFVAVHCASMPAPLLDDELFGPEADASGARGGKSAGKFEAAEGGTLFLDDVCALEPALQTRLLRAMLGKEIPTSSGEPRPVRTRVISATSRDLAELVRRDRYRRDLYQRLSVFPIQLPPLRECREDILELARLFLRRFAGQENRPARGIHPEVEEALLRYDWPGNVQEMETMFYHAVSLAESEFLEMRDFPVLRLKSQTGGAAALGITPSAPPETPVALWEAEAEAIRHALANSSGNVSLAARLLRISRATLYRKSRKLGIPLR